MAGNYMLTYCSYEVNSLHFDESNNQFIQLLIHIAQTQGDKLPAFRTPALYENN